jgi:hypothetical protein
MKEAGKDTARVSKENCRFAANLTGVVAPVFSWRIPSCPLHPGIRPSIEFSVCVRAISGVKNKLKLLLFIEKVILFYV